jgi:hypothetical protein
MYTLTFTNWDGAQVVKSFEDSSDAVNEAVKLQVNEGGYNTSGDWYYEVTDEQGQVVYADESMRYF